MGIFDIFKRKKIFIKDDYFGGLEKINIKNSNNTFYDGTLIFDNEECRISIETETGLPKAEHKEFIILFRENYHLFQNTILKDYLKRELEDWYAQQQIESVTNEFIIDAISLPTMIEKPILWELSLYSKVIEHWIIIKMIDWQPQANALIDG